MTMPSGSSERPFVARDGTSLVAPDGTPFCLNGVNLGGWLMWEGWIWARGFDYVGETKMMSNLAGLVGATTAEQFRDDVRGAFVTADDLAAVAALGFNVVRVPINHVLLEDDASPFVYRQAGWDVLDRLLDDAEAAGVYVVLDLHAAPGSQAMSFTADYTAKDFLWWTRRSQDRTVALWAAIAARYANRTIIAGYDLLNEPFTIWDNLLDLYGRITDAVRAVDPNHLLIYEGLVGIHLSRFTGLPDPNSALSFHYYSVADLPSLLDGYVSTSQRLDVPVWCGEYGQKPKGAIRATEAALDARPFCGRALWTWKQSPGFLTYRRITHTALSQKLVDYMANTTRPKPTVLEAQQGMIDFLRVVRDQR